ncbi:flagellar hook-basal body complex protein FliE [Paracraurococcus ruber]|uniref:Flagellar hook-basal body complex protein FliE n=1 Tax=Paracraurococcus ruber TaxID=77675 RepID=A0ABS1D5G6_9PROT|nr:flagellar hook-basal body complex protein FliE [Paracraurococcus ruber]MBK1661743.1 flagellar hook-basal body complex protein FliE [Paracraurococcus ruber]TDG17934.1 flagellar hook-basal body complex protein FliE [Paracraurococcus ruber]
MAGGIGPLQAAAAYRAAQSQPGEGVEAAPGADFGSALRRAMEDGVQLGRAADASSTQALVGQGSVTDVVLAVSRAEMALQTAVTLRDRVVAAYQDVMRMPI